MPRGKASGLKEEVKKVENEVKKVEKVMAKAAGLGQRKVHRGRNARHPVLNKFAGTMDLSLTPGAVSASAGLLQPDKFLARGLGTAGNRFPGSGDPTATAVVRAYLDVSIETGSTLICWAPFARRFAYTTSDEVAKPVSTRAAPMYVWGMGFMLHQAGPGSGLTMHNWPAWGTEYTWQPGGAGATFSAYVMVLPMTLGTLAIDITPLAYTDGTQVWQDINAVDGNGVPVVQSPGGGEVINRMKWRLTGGDLLLQAAPTIETSCIAAGFVSQTGSSGIFHTDQPTAGLRANARTYDYHAINVNNDGFNLRYTGPTSVNYPYDSWNPNQTFEDADEDDVTLATLDSRLATLRQEILDIVLESLDDAGVVDGRYLHHRLQDVEVGPADTDSPPEIPETVSFALIHNSGPDFDAAITAAFAIEFTPPVASGFETRAVLPDANWAKVLEVSHSETPFFVGPHSFGDFFSSLWGGIKSAASAGADMFKGVLGAAANGAGQAAMHGMMA